MKDLPVYKMSISENDDNDIEVTYIALVDEPAIQKNFFAYKETAQSFSIENEDERIITGLAMVADLPIYRRDKDGEFYTVFDAQSIKQIAQKFFRKQYNYKFNLSHDETEQPDGIYIFESWIVDREKGKIPMEQFKDVSNGSWIISAKIDNDEVWQQIKSGEFKGFSVQGFFKMEREKIPAQMSMKEFDTELLKLLQSSL